MRVFDDGSIYQPPPTSATPSRPDSPNSTGANALSLSASPSLSALNASTAGASGANVNILRLRNSASTESLGFVGSELAQGGDSLSLGQTSHALSQLQTRALQAATKHRYRRDLADADGAMSVHAQELQQRAKANENPALFKEPNTEDQVCASLQSRLPT